METVPLKMIQRQFTVPLIALLFLTAFQPVFTQSLSNEQLSIRPEETYQTVVGFGASLAYYENWLNAHPKKNEIYEAVFGELSLDILRVRNAHDYDPEMVGRVQEYVEAAEVVRGYPISLLSTSWGPPGYLKNTGDRKNGGTLSYTTGSGGIEFDYAGFAHWWGRSMDEYNAHGIFPEYISIQNEPDWSASWETCLFTPAEVINASDTIAGYNSALDAVYDTLMLRSQTPKILGPETVGIGYNSVENYVNALDLAKLDGIAHHLYHGVDENNPYASTDFAKVGDFHPEVPHFQSEYSRGDWFSLAGLIYRSFYDEQVVAYLYWDLIWNEGGLVQLDFPWDQDQWIDPLKGYTKTRDFYAFKQFSAFIHPGWKMTGNTFTRTDGATLTFVSPTGDSAACVVINRSDTEDLNVHVSIPGYRIHDSFIYTTSESENCELKGSLTDSLLTISPHSITTLDMRISEYDPLDDTEAPTLEATDSIYQEGIVEAVSSEDGMVYLVAEGTAPEIATIREAIIDSVAATAGVMLNIPISGLENGFYWLYATDTAGNISEPEVITLLGVGMEKSMVQQFNIFPNPFTRSTTIQFTLIKAQHIRLIIVDSWGREIRKESLGQFSPGAHRVVIQREEIPAGFYLFKLENSRKESRSGRLIIRD